MEEGELFQIDEILPVLGVALGKNRHSAGDDAASLVHQLLQRLKALTGGDHIVHNENPLALQQVCIGGL